MQNDFVPIAQGQVRHGVAADQGRRGHMEDATVAVPDFRDNLNQELAAQAPDANCFYGVRHQWAQFLTQLLRTEYKAY